MVTQWFQHGTFSPGKQQWKTFVQGLEPRVVTSLLGRLRLSDGLLGISGWVFGFGDKIRCKNEQ